MDGTLAYLEPRELWTHFEALARIPRPSGHEQRVVAWVRTLAGRHGFDVRTDAVGNVVLAVPASGGRERHPPVVLQGHLDMVCEKDRGVAHDFMTDPIRLRLDGEWVRAEGTTLGADNGIGVAAALAVATDPSVAHGPLELLFTIDEETGLTGAQRLDPALLRGRTLLNLDSEEDGKLFVGCAGGADTHLFLPPARARPASGSRPRTLRVQGLRGGHSGLNIHENRGNALKLAARLLGLAAERGIAFELAAIAGGNKHNAIPREAEAELWLPRAAEAAFDELVEERSAEFRAELAGIDEGVELRLEEGCRASQVLVQQDRDRLLDLLLVLPHGVLGMSPAIAGLVETSSNLAVVDEADGRIRIVTSSRSSVMSLLRGTTGSIRAAARLGSCEAATHDGYPGWKPDLASPVLGQARAVYGEVWGRPAEVTAVHAGLECGLLGEKVPGLDMVSFGPQIEGAHSPTERVSVPSVERFWRALVLLLGRLSA